MASLPSYVPPNQANIWEQANQQAQGIYGPVLAQIAAQYDRDRQEAIARQAAQASTIQSSYAEAAPKLDEIYQSAINQGQNLENAVSSRLAGVGQHASTDFATRLNQINAPAGSGIDLEGLYKNVGAANYARGMNDVSRLNSRKAEAASGLQRQGLAARQQSQSELATSLNELFKSFSDERGRTMAGIPGETQNIFDKIYGQRQQEEATKRENAWKQVAFIQEQIQNAQEQKLAAQALGDKKAARAAAARQKALDRELQAWKAQLSADTSASNNANTVGATIRGQDVRAATAAAGQKAAAGKKGKGNDTVDTAGSAKRNRAVQSAWSSVTSGSGWNAAVLDKLRRFPNSADAIINTAINASLRAQGVDPNSAAGKSIRKGIRQRLGGRVIKRQDGKLIGRFTP